MAGVCNLLGACCHVLSTFNPASCAVEEHLQEQLISPGSCSCLEEEEKLFLTEVFAGTVRHQNLIKVVVNGFYASDGKTCSRGDIHLYSVLSYLVMFRLEELGMDQFKKLIESQPPAKTLKFLRFLFNEANLTGWIENEWCRVYDKGYVHTSVLSPMLRMMPDMQNYMYIHLQAVVDNKLTNTRVVKPPTETQPFDITGPRPRRVPTPEESSDGAGLAPDLLESLRIHSPVTSVPTMKPTKPVPASTYVPPAEIELLARQRELQKEKAQDKLKQADRLQFSCAKTDKSLKTKAIIEQISKEREDALQFEPFKPLTVPDSIHKEQPVKLNTAAILREGARVQRLEQEEEKRLADIEAGEKDSSEYLRWQELMRQKDAAEQLAKVERSHLEGQISYEEAIIAKQNRMSENKLKVTQLKEEAEKLMQQYFSKRDEEKREMRQLVETIMQGHNSAKAAKTKLQKMKRKIVQQVAKEKQELMAKALEEAEADMQKRVELIQQIRAMESVPIIRAKFVDPTATSNRGFFTEMSLTELRERLALMKASEEDEKERKRKEIAASRLAKEQLLSETMESISRRRVEQNTQTKIKQEQQKKASQQQKQLHTSQSSELSDLQQKLEAKRKEREKLKQEARKSCTKATASYNNSSNRVLSSCSPTTTASAMATLLRTTNTSRSDY